MKSFFFATFLALVGALTGFGQVYTGPIEKPTSGYGADGPYTVATQAFSNPNFPTEDIVIYYPAGITTSVPTVFYSHGFGGSNPANVTGLMHFVAQKGYAIVFVPYQSSGVTHWQRYDNLLNGFLKAARDFPDIIDTNRVGFMGHSFGGGATFANAHYCFTQLNWGSAGRFMFASAQWYSLNISQSELQNFPDDVKLLTIVYENDSTNDHRMANDVFNTIQIAPSEKDYIRVKSDTIGSYTYDAIHGVPNTASAFDALDYYTLYRLLDALCDYTFNGSVAGKNVSLGNGDPLQITMPGGMHNLVQSDAPHFSHPENYYTYPCNSPSNPRELYCNGFASTPELSENTAVSVYPNPVNSVFTLETDQEIASVELYNSQGNLVKTGTTKQVDIHEQPAGLYVVKVVFSDHSLFTQKIVKQ
jgi:dienelactone hydrolase